MEKSEIFFIFFFSIKIMFFSDVSPYISLSKCTVETNKMVVYNKSIQIQNERVQHISQLLIIWCALIKNEL